MRTKVSIKPPRATDATQKLQKTLAQAGLGSRRTMEEWIRGGKVTVNGAIAAIGARVSAEDRIEVDRRPVRVSAPSQPRVLLYHKPEGEIVTRDDPAGRPSVFDKLSAPRGTPWIAIGRLDYNSSGLLIFTTSGDLANRLMHPRFQIEREYAVRIVGQLSDVQIERLRQGILLDDGNAQFDYVEAGGGEGTNRWYRVVCKVGRNRIVRRMFEALGFTVSRLMRVRFGPLSLPPRLKRGRSLELMPADVKRLLEWIDANPPVAISKSAVSEHP